MDVKPHKLNSSDYRAVASLHCDHINQGFLATLGVPFLTLLYEAIDRDSESVLLVEENGSQHCGLCHRNSWIGANIQAAFITTSSINLLSQVLSFIAF